jgi:acetyl-CoA C-acetyltransferase
MRESEAKRRKLKPWGRIIAQASHAQAPAWFTTAPIGAMKKALSAAGWSARDVDLYEINEAFAVVTMAAMRDLDLPHDMVNIHGGACALGHPVGASGTRIIVTLLSALERQGKTRGMASLCIGGGEATAVAVERVV